ncbi:hypothetical protein EH222_01070, partial [candidate division KSB1 bacterium]
METRAYVLLSLFGFSSAFAQLHRDWITTYSSGGFQSLDTVHDMKMDPQGNIYLTGTTQPPDHYYYYTTVKYGPDGDILWKQDFDMQEHIDVIG